MVFTGKHAAIPPACAFRFNGHHAFSEPLDEPLDIRMKLN
jgi:hypothetical protein